MADTFIKRPVLYKGTKAQIESATMGENDFAVATDVEFYTKEEVDSLIAGAGGGGLESVSHDASLTGAGTADSPLGIASTVTAQINSKADQTAVDVLSGEVNNLMGDFAQLPSTYVTQQSFANEISAINNDTTSIKETLNGKVNIAQGAENAGKILKVDDAGNVVVGEGGGASLPILMSIWSDRVINDMSWLRADTFSWHSGDVYVAAYQHLSGDMTGTKYYCWGPDGGYTRYIFTESETPKVGDVAYLSDNAVLDLNNLYLTTTISDVGTGWVSAQKSEMASRNTSLDITLLSTQTDTIGNTTITYYLADDGHKICLPDQESNLIALYEATGVAWYYVLDTENKRFKLPREDKDGEYLYFYVGNFEQSAIEQTAGITAETLNGKADTDLGNITSAAKTKIAGMGLPDYTAGVLINSAQTFVTTENCYVLANHENGNQINFTITYPDGSTGTISFGTYANDVIFIPFYFNAGVTLKFTTGRFRIYPLTKGL